MGTAKNRFICSGIYRYRWFVRLFRGILDAVFTVLPAQSPREGIFLPPTCERCSVSNLAMRALLKTCSAPSRKQWPSLIVNQHLLDAQYRELKRATGGQAVPLRKV